MANFIDINQLSKNDLIKIIELAIELKNRQKKAANI